MDATGRLERLLLLLSYVRQHPGAHLDDVARAVGVNARELKRMIPELSLCGKPPFSPDDLIDIFIDRDGRVHVEYDQSLGRPMRFTRPESLALTVALRTLAGSGAGPWAEAAGAVLERMRAVLGAEAVAEVEQRFAVEAERPEAVQDKFRVLSEGLSQSRTVEVVYYTASRDELLRRQVDPYAVVQFLGSWYVVGHDHLRGEVRIFKVERIREATLTDARFARPADFDARHHLPGRALGAAETARIRFRPDVARLVAEEHPPARVVPEADGSIVLELDFAHAEWVAGWVLPFGDAAEVLEPASVRALVAARCREALAHYENGSLS
jgi:proteasome accessory factor C